MVLFIEDGAPVIVQGMTGHQGMTHTARMLKAGTNIVGGVNARKAGLDVTFPKAKDGQDAEDNNNQQGNHPLAGQPPPEIAEVSPTALFPKLNASS